MIDDLQPINNGSQPAPVPSPVTPAPIQTTVATPSFVSTPPVVPIPQATVPQVSPLRQSGVVQAMPIVSNYVVPRKNGLKYVALIILLFLALGGGYVFAAKYNFVPNILPRLLPFAQSAYTPQTFFSSILAKSAGITSSAYKATFSLDVGNRDIDAKPFQVVVTNEAAIREQYQNDSQRAQDISSILSLFPRISTYDNKLKKYIVVPVIYPATLQKAVANVVKNNQYYRNTSITDPSTEKEYVYKSTEGGNNFNLTLTFETDDAIKAIRRSNPVATTTMINGKTVTFTKDSQTYFYLPTEPPKPILVQLGEMMRSLPADVKVSFDAGAQADFTNISTMANWLAQFNAEGSFGDLSYKVNAEARKKDSNYYVRINNIPSIVGSYASLKGKWIKISAEPSTSTDKIAGYNQFDYVSQELQSAEKTYKEQRQNLVTFLKKAAEIGDQLQVIEFKNPPRQETVDGRSLTRYDIQFRKDAILPFYQKLSAELKKDPTFSKSYDPLADQGAIDYLQSKEFSQVFDYMNQNTQLIFWTDDQGYPAIVEEILRVVPPDTATQLKDKQVNVEIKLSLNDINKPVIVLVPENATPISEIMTEIEKNQYGYDVSGEAKMQAALSSVRAQSEVVYSSSKNSYGANPYPLGACKQTVGTLFGNADLFKLIQQATNNDSAKATCISQGTSGKVSSYAVSAPLSSDQTYSWCVDSTGTSKQIKGSVKSSVCK